MIGLRFPLCDVAPKFGSMVSLDIISDPICPWRFSGKRRLDAALAEKAQARDLGVAGVPAFVIGGRRLVSGAQPAAFWVHTIDVLAEEAIAEKGSRCI